MRVRITISHREEGIECFFQESRDYRDQGGSGPEFSQDQSARSALRVSLTRQTISANETRQSTNNAFIRPMRSKRKNLTIKTESYVTKLLADPFPPKRCVVCVEYASKNNETKLSIVFAKKEVIVSAGSINSPKILFMLSGIRRREELKKHGIKVIYQLERIF